jgi:hypothetical protein
LWLAMTRHAVIGALGEPPVHGALKVPSLHQFGCRRHVGAADLIAERQPRSGHAVLGHGPTERGDFTATRGRAGGRAIGRAGGLSVWHLARGDQYRLSGWPKFIVRLPSIVIVKLSHFF